jgi:hypothetical protein
MIFLGGTPLGSPIVGWIGQSVGPRFAMALGGVISISAALIAMFATRGKLGISDL